MFQTELKIKKLQALSKLKNIIAYEIYEGDIQIYVNECVFDGTDICPSVSDMEEYGVTDKWSLSKLYYDIVKEYLKEVDYE